MMLLNLNIGESRVILNFVVQGRAINSGVKFYDVDGYILKLNWFTV